MKTIISIIISLTTFTISVAQPLVGYPPPGLIQGAVYHGDWTNPGIFNASSKYIGDTVISSYTYSFFTRENLPDYYTRYDNSKIYYATPTVGGGVNPEELKYDFNLSIGDTLPGTTLHGDLIVDSVGTITLANGSIRKYIRLKNYFQFYHHWVDGIGDINKGFTYYADFEGGYEELICVRDSSGLLYVNVTFLDCDSLSGFTTGVKTPVAFDFSISPVPATGTLNITFKDILHHDMNVQILNSFGQVQLNTQIRKFSMKYNLDVSFLKSGIYYLNVSSVEGHSMKKIIKL